MSWLWALLVSDFSHRPHDTLMPVRLRSHLHPGQETGDLVQRDWVPWRRRQRRAHSCDTKIVSTAIRQRYGALFPIGNAKLSGRLGLDLTVLLAPRSMDEAKRGARIGRTDLAC